MKTLRDTKEFKWYKKELDLKAKYEHGHYGEPEKYPCRVVSNWYDDPNGPYTYNHDFYYKQKESTKCDKCGYTQTKVFWPNVASLL